MTDKHGAIPRLPRQVEGPGPLERVREALRGLEHGEVTVVVQDGVVVQLRRTERNRLASNRTAGDRR